MTLNALHVMSAMLNEIMIFCERSEHGGLSVCAPADPHTLDEKLIVPIILVPIGLGWITNLVEFATAVVSIVGAGMFTTLTVLQLVYYVVHSNHNLN
jgi:hypothetical protein